MTTSCLSPPRSACVPLRTPESATLTLACSQTYNLASQIIALATADGTSNLTYDRDGQIDTVTTASGSGALPAEDFSFDASGNRDSTGYTTGSDNQTPPADSFTESPYPLYLVSVRRTPSSNDSGGVRT